jgi:hypothetical protein
MESPVLFVVAFLLGATVFPRLLFRISGCAVCPDAERFGPNTATCVVVGLFCGGVTVSVIELLHLVNSFGG